MTQSNSAVRAALLAACRTLYAASLDARGAPVLVCLGRPDTFQPDYIVAVAMNTRQPVDRPTMGTPRSRERMAEVDVTFSAYVPGGEESAATAADACEELTDALEDWLRTGTNYALSGACVDSYVTNIDGPRLDVATQPESGAVTGRVAESTVTITARIRY